MKKSRTSRLPDSSKRTFSSGSAARILAQLVFLTVSAERPRPSVPDLLCQLSDRYIYPTENYQEALSRRSFETGDEFDFREGVKTQISSRLSPALISDPPW